MSVIPANIIAVPLFKIYVIPANIIAVLFRTERKQGSVHKNKFQEAQIVINMSLSKCIFNYFL